MKKRNIGICIITTTLLMGGPAKATELILAKDHTNVVNQAAEIAAYKKEAETLKRQAVQKQEKLEEQRDRGSRNHQGEKATY